MVDKWWISAIAGAVVFVFGLALLRWSAAAWRAQKNDSQLEDHERGHYHRRYRRRLQMGVLLVLIGILLALGELIFDEKRPALWAAYYIAILSLVGWILLLALGDMVSTAHHSRVELAKVRYKQRELEQKLAEFRARRAADRDRRHEMN